MAKRSYTVTASSAVLEHEPGTQFEADLDPVQEARLIESGALEVVAKGGKPADPPKPAEKPPVNPESTDSAKQD